MNYLKNMKQMQKNFKIILNFFSFKFTFKLGIIRPIFANKI
jgi:hypothetical protein